ncbi:hypothetical protein CYCD_18100 [Tenuifilaceae bacterium CYCD]|nr:hypothetical protein CYCD_18100 [Tenuifilaceae bacterium CYCD]
MDKMVFSAIIEQNKGIDAAYVRFPYDTEKLFGTKGQVKIVATFKRYSGANSYNSTRCSGVVQC